MNLSFYPYQFSVQDVNFSVLPIDDNEFVYMDRDLDDIGVQLVGRVIAQNAKGERTSNFTNACVAKTVNLTLDVNVTSDTGFNTPLETVADNNHSRLPVLFNRSFAFNNVFTTVENNLSTITSPITIQPIDFRDSNNSNDGSLFIDLRYNISKNINRPINPIKIGFKTLTVNSAESYSKAEEINNWIPEGAKDLNKTRFFYFTQVASDEVIYPRVNFLGNPIVVNTPISVDIFCKKHDNPNFCTEMKIFENTIIHASPRKEEGWYISSNHNRDFDGNITTLQPLTNGVTVNPNSNIPFSGGQNYQIDSTIINANNQMNQVNIILPSQLQYLNPNYNLPLIGNDSSEWTGIGEAGRVISTKPNTNKSGKSDW
jgi:hypothetical protein